MNKGKKIDIHGLELDVPKKYIPEWLSLGKPPHEIDSNRLEEPVIAKKEQNTTTEDPTTTNNPYKRRARNYPNNTNLKKDTAPIVVLSDEEFDESDETPKIKINPNMQPAAASMWYTADMAVDNSTEIVDNNDIVDLDPIQSASPVVASIGQKIKSPENTTTDDCNRPAKPGEFILMYNGKTSIIGSLTKIKEKATKLLKTHGSTISNKDMVIFLRVPLEKVFK